MRTCRLTGCAAANADEFDLVLDVVVDSLAGIDPALGTELTAMVGSFGPTFASDTPHSLFSFGPMPLQPRGFIPSEEVSDVVVWLSGEHSGVLTGAQIGVDKDIVKYWFAPSRLVSRRIGLQPSRFPLR